MFIDEIKKIRINLELNMGGQEGYLEVDILPKHN